MRRIVFPLVLVSLVLSSCRDPKVTSYRVPKEKEPAHSPHDGHNHGAAPAPAGVAAAGATAPAPTSAGATAGGGSMASTPVATASGASLTWTAPAHWQSKQGSAMRKATFVVTGEGGATAELAVTAFPGEVGGEVANVNRWRGQINLPPLSEAEAGAAITRLEANGLKIGVVDLANTAGGVAVRVLGAFVPYGGATWFFKFTGPDAIVTKEKAAFLEFVKTIKPAA